MSQSPGKKPTLDLNTFIERQTIKIDGHTYELRNQFELSELTLRRLQKMGERMTVLEQLESPTKEDDHEHFGLTQKFVAEVLIDLPADVLKTLEIGHTTAIVLCFLGVPPQTPGPAAMTQLTRAKRHTRPTGARSSRN